MPRIIRLLFMLIAWFAAQVGCAETPGSLVKVQGVKASYRPGESISFMIEKDASDAITFACAAEVLVSGEFQEFRWDIFQNALKAGSMFRKREMRDAHLELKWDVANQLEAIRPEEGNVYRLRIDILSPREEHVYSPPFTITKAGEKK